jgi:dTMP kinase
VPTPGTRGRLIAFCGGEGAGKSTQIALLAAHLAASGRDVLVTREPGGTEEGQELRRLLLTPDFAWDRMAETLLMVADRAQHIVQLIEPALAAGRHVVTDRFVLSTLCYQGAARGVPISFIRELHRTACFDLWPDLTLILDIDPRIGIGRSKRRLAAAASDETRFEALDLEFHERVRAGFLDLSSSLPGRHVVIDATAGLEAIQARIRGEVDALLG